MVAADDIEEMIPRVRAAFDADIDPRLGTLILEMVLAAHCPAIDGEPMPDLEAMADTFGRMAAAAVIVGDASFFAQMSHCTARMTDTQGTAQENLEWLSAHGMARLMRGPRRMDDPPAASEVASAKNDFSRKTSIDATVAIDACNRKALKLPLAKGKRGRKVE